MFSSSWYVLSISLCFANPSRSCSVKCFIYYVKALPFWLIGQVIVVKTHSSSQIQSLYRHTFLKNRETLLLWLLNLFFFFFCFCWRRTIAWVCLADLAVGRVALVAKICSNTLNFILNSSPDPWSFQVIPSMSGWIKVKRLHNDPQEEKRFLFYQPGVCRPPGFEHFNEPFHEICNSLGN